MKKPFLLLTFSFILSSSILVSHALSLYSPSYNNYSVGCNTYYYDNSGSTIYVVSACPNGSYSQPTYSNPQYYYNYPQYSNYNNYYSCSGVKINSYCQPQYGYYNTYPYYNQYYGNYNNYNNYGSNYSNQNYYPYYGYSNQYSYCEWHYNQYGNWTNQCSW